MNDRSVPWAGLVPDEDVASMVARGRALDRPVTFGLRPALLVVDMTRAFVDARYPTSCDRWGGAAATAACARLLGAARRSGVPVFFTRLLDERAGHRGPSARGRVHMDHPEILATPAGLPDGNEIDPQLEPADDEAILAKPKASAFFATPLEADLTYRSVDTVVVVGMVTSGCVRATVIDASMRNLVVLVPHAAVADYSWFQHRASLFDMHVKYADVCELADAERCFETSGRTSWR